MGKYEELRLKHPLFIYHSYTLTDDTVEFHFQIDEYHFYPKWYFEKKLTEGEYSRSAAEYAAFSLGMAELVSYWKTACSPNVEIHCGTLNKEQITWWKKLYFNGLGEFFYRNGITTDFASFMTITANNEPLTFKNNFPLSGALVPVGGGKDSVVSLEMLRSAGEEITPYIINALPSAVNCALASGASKENIIAPKLSLIHI